MPKDARLSRLGSALAARPAAIVPREPGLREAAVALLLRPRDEVEVLLIKRAVVEGDPWSGHMALPGGRRSQRDADLLETAVRESAEEVGIPVAESGRLLGRLDDVAPHSPRLPPIVVTPFVLAVPPDTPAYPDPREVAAALWIPLSALQDRGAVGEILVELETGPLTFPALRYGEHEIWGLTFRILGNFLELAAEAGL